MIGATRFEAGSPDTRPPAAMPAVLHGWTRVGSAPRHEVCADTGGQRASCAAHTDTSPVEPFGRTARKPDIVSVLPG